MGGGPKGAAGKERQGTSLGEGRPTNHRGQCSGAHRGQGREIGDRRMETSEEYDSRCERKRKPQEKAHRLNRIRMKVKTEYWIPAGFVEEHKNAGCMGPPGSKGGPDKKMLHDVKGGLAGLKENPSTMPRGRDTGGTTEE